MWLPNICYLSTKLHDVTFKKAVIQKQFSFISDPEFPYHRTQGCVVFKWWVIYIQTFWLPITFLILACICNNLVNFRRFERTEPYLIWRLKNKRRTCSYAYLVKHYAMKTYCDVTPEVCSQKITARRLLLDNG